MSDNRLTKKAVELEAIKHVAIERGGLALPEGEAEWPDGWLLDDQERIPVEVVAAPERPSAEDPSRGAGSMRALATARRQAEHLSGQDTPAAYGAHAAEGWIAPLDGTGSIPLRMSPIAPVDWIETAVRQKVAKEYAEAQKLILVVDLRQAGWPALYDHEVAALQNQLKTGVAFREVWVATGGGTRVLDQELALQWGALMEADKSEEAAAIERQAFFELPVAQRILPPDRTPTS